MAIGAYGDSGSSRGSKKSIQSSNTRSSPLRGQPYQSRYRGSTTNPGFTPVKAVDQTEAIKEQERQQLLNMREVDKALDRHNSLGKFYLDSQQRVEAEQLRANQIIEEADQKGNFETINGLISLSDTLNQSVKLYSEIKEERELNQMSLDAILGGEAATLVDSQPDVDASVTATGLAVGEMDVDGETSHDLRTIHSQHLLCWCSCSRYRDYQ